MRFQKERMRALSERLRSMFGRMRDLFLGCVSLCVNFRGA